MGVKILYDGDNEHAALYCSTSEVAFGPIFHDDHGHDARDRAELFLKWLGPRDARQFTDRALLDLYGQWAVQEIDKWRKEDGEDVIPANDPTDL